MKFSKDQEDIFEKIIDEFTAEHGKDALKAVHQLHSRLRKEIGVKYFPVINIFHYLLYQDLKTKYKTIPLKKIAQIENISTRGIYHFYNHYAKSKKPRVDTKKTG